MQLGLTNPEHAKPSCTMPIKRLATYLFVTAMIVCVGCTASSDAADNQQNSVGKAARALSYEVITETKPSNFDEFVKANRTSQYEVCASSLAAMGKQALPFPQIPQDFVMQQSTWISDGKNYYSQVVSHKLASAAGDPIANLCKIEIITTVETQISKNGKHYLRHEQAGHPATTSVVDSPESSKLALSRPSRSKTVNGHNLVCTDLPMKEADICYFWYQDMVIADSGKLAIPAYQYDDNLPSVYRGITTPVSAKFNIQVNSTLFNTP